MSIRSLLILAVASVSLVAQQAGTVNRNYTVNANGALAIDTTTCTQTVAYDSVAAPGTMANVYSTQDANTPVAWLASPNFSLPGLPFGPNEVNLGTPGLGFADVSILADGSAPGFINSLFRTDNLSGTTHSFSISVPTNITLVGQIQNFCMLHFAASSPVGVWVSQVHNVGFGIPNAAPQNPNPNAIDPFLQAGTATPNGASTALVGPGDDTSTLQALGMSFTFYGTTYTQLWAGSNGYLTATSFTTLTESAATLVTAPAKIVAWWDDLNFNATGAAGNASLRFYTDGVSTCEFSWVSVPEFATTWSATNQNNFKITLTQGAGGGTITMDYGLMASVDGLAGLSAGTAAYSGLAVNLTRGVPASANPVCANRDPYELFTSGAAGNDLGGKQITWILDGTGTPIAWF